MAWPATAPRWARVAAAEAGAAAGVLDAFFAPGEREGETRQDEAGFTRVLAGWTRDLAGGLAPAAGLLLAFLSRLEPEDRQEQIVETVWPHFLTRLGRPDAAWAPALDALEVAGLVGVERAAAAQLDDMLAQLTAQAEQAGLPPAALQGILAQLSAGTTTYTLHPGVAEAVRATANPAVLVAADVELGDYHYAMVVQALKQEMQGMSSAIAASAPAPRPTCCARVVGTMQGCCWKRCSSATVARPRSPSPCRCCAASLKPPWARNRNCWRLAAWPAR